MLRMIIADDEKIIRETIYSIIDWAAINIEVVGLCKDGIEAFDSIVDEYPDIVMTDIKMPGLSGLDLIQKVKEAELDVEFVILSGYGEFEFAKEAMKYGVKHYLLKPCSENEIIQVMQTCTAACQKKTAARLDDVITELFDGAGYADEQLQQKFFSLLSSQQDISGTKMHLVKLLMEAGRNERYLLNNVQITEYIMALNSSNDMETLLRHAKSIMAVIFSSEPQHKYVDCVEKIMEYVNNHFSDSNLSLKWIAENYLYMNADYVSKQFVRSTGSKFSVYLTTIRIQEAKKLLLDKNLDSPYSVAEKVGFGNNPQYFSQIFKKYTGMTPIVYARKMTGN